MLLDDYVVMLGAKWRYLRSIRESFADERAEYEEARDEALARVDGAPKISFQDSRGNQFFAVTSETGLGGV